ncbi:MAG: MCE family protein [Actinomycetota bacterium]|nr:MCE family protein [Actinomycetota bacterium]
MKTTASLVKLIVFMIITSILTLFLAATIGTISFGGKTRYHALFSDVTGLLTGNDVRIAGVKVGQVDKIGLKDQSLADVTFSLEQGRRIPASAIIRLRYRNLVGERYLAVTEGPGSADPLPANATIPLAQTRNALDLTILFNGFRPLFTALDPASINAVAFELIQTLQGEGGTLQSLMIHTASLTSTLADKDALIGRVITNLGTVLQTVDQRSGDLSRLVIQLKELSAGFAGDRAQIGSAISGIGDLTSATASLLSDIRPSLGNDIGQLQKLAGTLDANKATIDGVLTRLPSKLDRIIGTATYGSWFNFYLCGFDGRIVLPTGVQMIPMQLNHAARCQR